MAEKKPKSEPKPEAKPTKWTDEEIRANLLKGCKAAGPGFIMVDRDQLLQILGEK